MIQTEDREIDRALQLCKLIQSDLLHCVKFVQRLDRKYNKPDRYRIDTTPFDLDGIHKRENMPKFGLTRTANLSQSVTSLPSWDCDKIEGRSSHELDAIFVNLKSKCIKLRRELEATAAHAQRIIDCSARQQRVQHSMLSDAQGVQTFICNHWGNKFIPRTNSNQNKPKK